MSKVKPVMEALIVIDDGDGKHAGIAKGAPQELNEQIGVGLHLEELFDRMMASFEAIRNGTAPLEVEERFPAIVATVRAVFGGGARVE